MFKLLDRGRGSKGRGDTYVQRPPRRSRPATRFSAVHPPCQVSLSLSLLLRLYPSLNLPYLLRCLLRNRPHPRFPRDKDKQSGPSCIPPPSDPTHSACLPPHPPFYLPVLYLIPIPIPSPIPIPIRTPSLILILIRSQGRGRWA